MSEQSWTETELIEIWLAANDGHATAEQFDKLSRLLVEDAQARNCVIALAGHQAWLSWQEAPRSPVIADFPTATHDEGECDAAADPAKAQSSGLAATPPQQSQPAAAPPLTFGDRWGIDWRGTTILLLILLLCLWLGSPYLRNPHQNDVARDQAQQGPAEAALAESPSSEFVARIVRASRDLKWNDSAGQLDFLLRLQRNVPIRIDAGLVQIEFFSGAKIVLQGPAVFVPTGPASAQLDSGRLTGDVENGNFRLITQSAEVIDLGTTFGVSVDADTGTDVVVFKGEVRVVSQPSHNSAGETINMSEGMAARVRIDGTTDYEFRPVESDYSRSVPETDLEPHRVNLSLVDVLSGGNGLDICLAGAVDPLTGRMDHGKWRLPKGPGRRHGDGKFHVVDWHPLIDGVFVPPDSGKQTQIDSLGHVVDLPANNGYTWGPVWGRRFESVLEAADNAPDFWGTNTLDKIVARLKETQLGIVGMHANVGITLDLQAIRLQQHCSARSFQADLANLDILDETEPAIYLYGHKADFRVYVDGELRFSRLGFTKDDGDAHIVIPLDSHDSRLTLVSTDAEGRIWCDHIVLIDPVLVLEK